VSDPFAYFFCLCGTHFQPGEGKHPWGQSNLSTGVFWLCYYKALQTGAAFKVISIAQLRVVITMTLAILLCAYFIPNAIIDCILNAAGILLVVL
jgi:uncharacterized membrane protein